MATDEVDRDQDHHPDSPDAALRFRMLQDQDENGDIPADGLMRAKAYVDSMRANQEIHPAAGINSSGWTWLGPGNIGGRVRSIVIDPTAPATWWAGSVSGGIWKSLNAGGSWAPVNDFLANLSVSTLVMQPGNPNVLYAGTGEYQQGLQGAGVFRTTDGGKSWTQLPSTTNSNFYYVNRLSVSPNGAVILAATSTGIYRSMDLGATFSLVLNTTSGAYHVPTYVSFDPTNSARAIASAYDGSAWYSTNGGVTWTAASGLPAASWGHRVELAYAPSNAAIVYASVDVTGSAIYKSTNGGASYSLAAGGLGYFDLGYGDQGWYDNAIWVDPTNSNVVVAAGIVVVRSMDGGATWTRVNELHPDNHTIVSLPGFTASNPAVVIGNDGGIQSTANIYTAGSSSLPSYGWVSKNNNLGITQFYGAAGNNATGTIIGGTQDNGTLRYTTAGGPQAVTRMAGGDGGYAAADQTDPNYFFGEYQWLQIHRSSNGGFTSTSIGHTIPDYNGNSNFIAPFVLDPTNPNTLLAGGASLWRSTNAKATTPIWASIKAPVGFNFISAVAVAPSSSNVCWVGHNSGDVYRTQNCTAASPAWTRVDGNFPGLPKRMVTRLTIDPNNANRVYATFGGYSAANIWRTDNGGSTWTNVSGSGLTALPQVPVHDVEISPVVSTWLYAATEIGVFTSEDGGTTWQVPQDGPSNVEVTELFWMGQTLVAATFGRGLYKTSPATNHTMTVAVQGSGTVTTVDLMIQCPSFSCSHSYASGQSVTLRSTPASGNVFAGWSSSACSSGTVLMTADAFCTATFLPTPATGARPGSLSLSGSGYGDVFTYNVNTGAHASELSDGQGHFGELRATWSAGWQISAADFNGDGFADFFLYNAATGAWYKALNNGTGDFTYFPGQWAANWQVYIVDLNGDHHSDIFLYNQATGDWYRCASTGDGTGDFAYVSGHWSAGWQIYPADLNGDGKSDLFLYHPTFGWWYQVLNDGTSFSFTPGQWSAGWSITPGDFNGDGKTDFFLSNPTSGEWYVATTVPRSFSYSHGSWSAGWTFTAADFNGDGKMDLFLYNPGNGWWYEALSDGAGGFTYAFGTWSANWQVQATDLNADGRSDLVLYNPASGQWYQAMNTGVGSFAYQTGVWDRNLTIVATMPRIP